MLGGLETMRYDRRLHHDKIVDGRYTDLRDSGFPSPSEKKAGGPGRTKSDIAGPHRVRSRRHITGQASQPSCNTVEKVTVSLRRV